MRTEIIVHIMNEEAFYADVERLPEPADAFVTFSNPRKRDGKPVNFGALGTQTFMVPWHRITYLEILPSQRERSDIFDFVREER